MVKKEVYSEVYAVLTALGDEYLRKTPKEFLNLIADNRDRDLIIKIDENIPLEEQNLSEEAVAMLAMLKLDHWCSSNAEKEELQALLDMNEQKANGHPLSKTSKEVWLKLLKRKCGK